MAAEKDYAQIVKLLANAGSNLNVLNFEQKTPLISAGADVNKQVDFSDTALLIATRSPEIAKARLDSGLLIAIAIAEMSSSLSKMQMRQNKRDRTHILSWGMWD